MTCCFEKNIAGECWTVSTKQLGDLSFFFSSFSKYIFMVLIHRGSNCWVLYERENSFDMYMLYTYTDTWGIYNRSIHIAHSNIFLRSVYVWAKACRFWLSGLCASVCGWPPISQRLYFVFNDLNTHIHTFMHTYTYIAQWEPVEAMNRAKIHWNWWLRQ